MPRPGLDDDRLRAALADLGQRVLFPSTPALRGRVLARLAERRPVPWWRRSLSPRYGLMPAFVTLALLLVAVLAFSPDARATAADVLRLGGVEIFRGPVPAPTPAASPVGIPSPSPAIDRATLGEPVTLAEARQRAGFRLVLPDDPLLGPPDAVYLRAVEGSVAVSFEYRVRPGIPVSPEAGIAALVTELGGRLEPAILGKVVGQGTTLELLTVNGQPGAWLDGRPHQVFYTTTGGASFVTDTLRLAGNTLVWEQGGIVMRLEAQVDKATALRIASTFR